MKNRITLSILLACSIFLSCEKEDPQEISNENSTEQKENNDDQDGTQQNDSTLNDTIPEFIISGYVQKGPFTDESSIILLELSSDLNQTGKSIKAETLNNEGGFKIENFDLSTDYVEIRARGYYYNEVSGNRSTGQLTLSGLSDLSDKNNVNINVLTHLQRDRIKYLVSNGYRFSFAKDQAQTEILSLFSIDKPDIADSEVLDISQDGDDNAILLAISLIIQGSEDATELSDMLTGISSDITDDGVLNDNNIGTKLLTQAQSLDLVSIRENIEKKYTGLNVEATIPNFEKYIKIFNSADSRPWNLIDYPEFGKHGENILFGSKASFNKHTYYSLAAGLAEGTELKIVLKGGHWVYEVIPEGPINWSVSDYNDSQKSQIFTSTDPGKACDLKIMFDNPATITIEYYENLSASPTKTKTITVN